MRFEDYSKLKFACPRCHNEDVNMTTTNGRVLHDPNYTAIILTAECPVCHFSMQDSRILIHVSATYNMHRLYAECFPQWVQAPRLPDTPGLDKHNIAFILGNDICCGIFNSQHTTSCSYYVEDHYQCKYFRARKKLPPLCLNITAGNDAWFQENRGSHSPILKKARRYRHYPSGKYGL